jgi:hypothetical protein
MMAEKELQITISQVSPEMPDARLVMFDDEIVLRVSLEPLKGNLYRLGTTPLTDDGGIYLGDIIEAEMQENGVLRYLRVVEASPLRHWSWLLSEKVGASAAFEAFRETIEKQGGIWERYFGGILFIHLPPGTPLDPQEEMKKVINTVQAKGHDG